MTSSHPRSVKIFPSTTCNQHVWNADDTFRLNARRPCQTSQIFALFKFVILSSFDTRVWPGNLTAANLAIIYTFRVHYTTMPQWVSLTAGILRLYLSLFYYLPAAAQLLNRVQMWKKRLQPWCDSHSLWGLASRFKLQSFSIHQTLSRNAAFCGTADSEVTMNEC